MWMIASPTPVPASDDRRHERHVREARDDHRQRRHAAPDLGAATRRSAARPDRRTRPSPTRGAASRAAIVSPRGEVCAGVPGGARDDQHRRRREQRAGQRGAARRSSGARAAADPPTAPIHAATQNSAKQISKSTIARPNAVTRYSGTSALRSNTERSESLAIEKSRYTGIAISPTTDDDHARHRHGPQRRPLDAPDQRPRDQHPHHEQADRGHHRQEHHPARDQQLRRRRGGRYLRHRELRRRSRVGADRVRERALHGMAVDRDRAPVDQVPALGQMRAQRHDQRVRDWPATAGPAPVVTWCPVGVGDRDDREPRLDRLVVGELDRGRRGRPARRLPRARS